MDLTAEHDGWGHVEVYQWDGAMGTLVATAQIDNHGRVAIKMDDTGRWIGTGRERTRDDVLQAVAAELGRTAHD